MVKVNLRNLIDSFIKRGWILALMTLLGAGGGAFWAFLRPPEFLLCGSFFVSQEESPQVWRMLTSSPSDVKLSCSQENPQLFSIHYWDKNAQQGAQIVNALMAKWEEFLEEEQRERVEKALVVLQQKQQDTLAELEKIQGQGVLSDHERVYLTALQEEYRQKEVELETALSSLDAVLAGIHVPSAPAHLNALTRELRTLTHQRQTLLLEGAEATARLQLCSAQSSVASDECRHLLIRYGESLEKTRGEMGQIQQLLCELDKPYFNISHLSTYLTDSVNASLITRACELLLILADEELHAPQERTKLLQELAHFKGLLGAQLKQKLRSSEERYKRTQEELRSVNKAQGDALDYHIATVREELSSQVGVGKRSLNEELTALRHRMGEIEGQLQPSPDKWRMEQTALLKKAHLEALTQLIDQQTRLEHGVEKPSRIVAPATVGKPRHKELVLLSAGGGGAGLLLSILSLSIFGIFQGPSHSLSALRKRGLSIAGRLSHHYATGAKLNDRDLEVMRNVWSLLGLKKKVGVAPVALVTVGTGPDFSPDLARLLVQQGERVLLIRCNFHEPASPEGVPGLVPYLKGKVQAPRIVSQGKIDTIIAGGTTRYAVELLGSPRFAHLLRASRKRYGVVLLASYAPFDGAEVRLLRELSDRVIVSLGKEPLPPDLKEEKAVIVLR